MWKITSAITHVVEFGQYFHYLLAFLWLLLCIVRDQLAI